MQADRRPHDVKHISKPQNHTTSATSKGDSDTGPAGGDGARLMRDHVHGARRRKGEEERKKKGSG